MSTTYEDKNNLRDETCPFCGTTNVLTLKDLAFMRECEVCTTKRLIKIRRVHKLMFEIEGLIKDLTGYKCTRLSRIRRLMNMIDHPQPAYCSTRDCILCAEHKMLLIFKPKVENYDNTNN